MTGEGVTRVTALTRSDSTEGGEEGKGERGGEEGGEEILTEGRTGTLIEGSTRGPRGPKNSFYYWVKQFEFRS